MNNEADPTAAPRPLGTGLAPLYACVLIGGRSSRMGRPKHLLPAPQEPPSPRAVTWVERIVGLASPFVVRVALSGPGEVPPALAGLDRVPDVPGLAGPMAGVLACMNWAPRAGWLVAACDLVRLTPDALAWLVSSRRPDAWAVLPRLEGASRVEPTLALYEPQARPLIAQLAAAGNFRLAGLADHPRVLCPVVPPQLRHAWHNANTPDDLILP